MRRTRMLCTIGPASDRPDTIAALMAAGADAFRLNFSHGTQDGHAEVCARIREVARAAGRSVAVMQDLAGPKIRIGALHAPMALRAGDPLVIEYGDFLGGDGRVSCAFAGLFSAAPAGSRLLVDDGRIVLDVRAVGVGRLDTRVVVGGVLGARKGINLPDLAVPVSALTPKDRDDLRAGIAMGVDLAAVSFVQTAEDIREARRVAAAAGAPDLPLFAKIEKPQALQHLDEILTEADGAIVARGDLGVELPLEALPAIQRRLILAARRHAVPVVVATEVLESMRSSARPTRAEVSDAALAVDQGADAIMLAGETAMGLHPEAAVRMLGRIIDAAESDVTERAGPDVPDVIDVGGRSPHARALCEAAVTLAARAGAMAIVAVTAAGQTARLLAAQRPTAAILAATPSPATAKRLALTWGVTPFVTGSADLEDVRRALSGHALLPAGGLVVFVSVTEALDRGDANFVHVERL